MLPSTITEVQSAVRSSPRLRVRGAGTKPALSSPAEGEAVLDLSALRGVLAYEPGEFVFTARAGTPVAEVEVLLAQHGQYLPFDPLLAERGATLGGTLAAGLSGPGRYRFGGLRDFILGVRYVDGEGELIRAGGQVVKNAAGFDIPKLMVGSLGRLGALVEVSFKVFPRPEAYLTLSKSLPDLDAAVQALLLLYAAPLDINAIDLVPSERGDQTLLVRLGGLAAALPRRAERVRALLGGASQFGEADDAEAWRAARELAWVPPGWTLVKVPLTPQRIPALEQALASLTNQRRYSGGGNVAWLASPEPPESLAGILAAQGLSGLVVLGPPGRPLIGAPQAEGFARRVQSALDPLGRFQPAPAPAPTATL